MIKRSQSFQFPFVGKIKPGSPKVGNAPGRNQPYFRLVSTLDENYQAEIDAKMGKEPKELRIHFVKPEGLSGEDALRYIFDDWYEAYKQSGLWCRGDGETAQRAVKKGEMQVVNCTCPELGKTCKQWGTLKCVPSELPLRGLWTLRVSSWNSINQIQQVLRMYHTALGTKMFAVQFVLYKQEQMVQTKDGPRKQFITKIKIAPEFANLIPNGAEFTMDLGADDGEFYEGEIPTEALDLGLDEQPVDGATSKEPGPNEVKENEPTHFTSDGEEVTIPPPPPASPEEPATPAPAAEPPKAEPEPASPEVPSEPEPPAAPPPVAEEPAKPVEPAQPVSDDSEGPLKVNTAGKSALWRAKASKVAQLVGEAAKLRNEKNESAILQAYGLVSFKLEDYTEQNLTTAIANLNKGIKELKEGVNLLTEDDIPF